MLIISCGGSGGGQSSSPVDSSVQIFETPVQDGNEVQISTSSYVQASSDSIWYLQLIHKGNKLGECVVEVIDTDDNGEHLIAFADESNPDCVGIEIDPSSSVSNLKLAVEDQGLEYCVLIDGVKSCQEISISSD